jgi:hypothetical protein
MDGGGALKPHKTTKTTYRTTRKPAYGAMEVPTEVGPFTLPPIYRIPYMQRN